MWFINGLVEDDGDKEPDNDCLSEKVSVIAIKKVKYVPAKLVCIL